MSQNKICTLQNTDSVRSDVKHTQVSNRSLTRVIHSWWTNSKDAFSGTSKVQSGKAEYGEIQKYMNCILTCVSPPLIE